MLCVMRVHKKWNDFQLSWQPEHYGNVNKTRVPINKLWVPDVAIFNRLVSLTVYNSFKSYMSRRVY